MSDCLFCNIVAGDIPAKKVYEDDHILAFHDINPKASVHVLVIPKLHVAGIHELTPEHAEVIAHLTLKLPEVARLAGLDDGFRTIVNTGPGGHQEIYHLHYHILGGQRMPGF